MEDHRDSTSTPDQGSYKDKGKAMELETGGNGGGGAAADLKQPKMEETVRGITDAVHVSWRLPTASEMEDPRDSTSITPEGSDKNKGKAVELETGGNGGAAADLKQPKMEETTNVITDAVPLTWRIPTASGKYLGNYLDGKYHYGLPFGWLVEPRPRTSPKYIGKADQYFYEPGTGRQFRSLKAVKKYLENIGKQQEQPGQDEQQARQNDDDVPTPVQKQDGHAPESVSQPKRSQRKNVGRKRKQASRFVFDPSKKVLWALADDIAETDQRTPFVGEDVVP